MTPDWTVEQLGKWRIRKAGPGEQPPWARHRVNPDASRFAGAALQPLPPPPPWWVYAPGEPGPVACWGTHDDAVNHVLDAICNRVVGRHIDRLEGRL